MQTRVVSNTKVLSVYLGYFTNCIAENFRKVPNEVKMAAPFRRCSRIAADLRNKLPPSLTEFHSSFGKYTQNLHSKKSSVVRSHLTFSFPDLPTFTLPQINITRRHYSTKAERKCWKCGNNVDNKEQLFFCKCGVVQSIKEVDYFELMGIPESFDIDLTSLTQRYRDLQRQLHPDKYTLKSEVRWSLMACVSR